jgi:hypothetical protein
MNISAVPSGTEALFFVSRHFVPGYFRASLAGRRCFFLLPGTSYRATFATSLAGRRRFFSFPGTSYRATIATSLAGRITSSTPYPALRTGLLSLCPSGTIFRLLSLRSFLLRRRRGTTADRPPPIAQRWGDSSAAGPGPYVDAHGLKSGLSFLGPSGRSRQRADTPLRRFALTPQRRLTVRAGDCHSGRERSESRGIVEFRPARKAAG